MLYSPRATTDPASPRAGALKEEKPSRWDAYGTARAVAPAHCNWRRHWHPTPVLLPGKFHGRRSLVGRRPWDCWVGCDWVTSLSLFTFMYWRRKWQPTPVFLPGEPQGRGSLVGCRLMGFTESDTTAVT